MTRLKFLAFATATVVLSVVMITAGLFALDLYAHHRVQRSAGLNWRGYRGPTVGRKLPGELRVAMLGGSTVFGYGVGWDETIPAVLERLLTASRPQRPTRVVNLGLISEGAAAFLTTLQDFDNLQLDVVCLYEGYNDLRGDRRPNLTSIRHQSSVFRLTGYFPVLPLVLREKANLLRYGDADEAYPSGRDPEDRQVFRPNVAQRTSAAAIEVAASVSEALGQQLDRLASQKRIQGVAGRAGCAQPWAHYCDFVHTALEYSRSRGQSVVVVGQPRMIGPAGERHADQQRALSQMIARLYSGDPRIRYVDLSYTVDLGDRIYAFDRMHLTPPGNAVIAEALVGPVEAVANARQPQ